MVIGRSKNSVQLRVVVTAVSSFLRVILRLVRKATTPYPWGSWRSKATAVPGDSSDLIGEGISEFRLENFVVQDLGGSSSFFEGGEKFWGIWDAGFRASEFGG